MINKALDNEQQLIAGIAVGDQGAFTLVVDAYWKKVYNHALAYTQSPVVAEEITQDVFLKVWMKRALLLQVNDFKNYLFILSRNQIVSALRKNLTKTHDIGVLEFPETALPPDKQLQYKETYSKILEIIEALPPARRKIFKMSRLDGLSYDEIAKALNLSKNTVKRQIVIALNFLRTNCL